MASLSDNSEDEELDDLLSLAACADSRSYKEATSWRNLYLNAEGRRRRERKLSRDSLLSPKKSPWQKLYSAKNDQAYLTVTGFDVEAFHTLLGFFAPLFYRNTPWTGNQDGTTYKPLIRLPQHKKGGRKRIICAHACLGLVLSWYRFRGAEYTLQGWFGFTGSHANVWLRFGRRMLFKALLEQPLALPEWPDEREVEKLKAIVVERHNALRGVFCYMDGLKVFFESCKDLDKQSMFYNGWQHGHFVNNLLVFGADGRIIKCVLNVPGSVHDSTMCVWGQVYSEMNEIYHRNGGKCVVDSAFNAHKAKYLIKSAQTVNKAKDEREIVVNSQATSARQCAEWGMRAIQSAFPRLKDKMKYQEDGGPERRMLLKLAVMLYNYRLELVGLNQIRNTYVPQWSKDADYMMCSFDDE
jgi:hypothetical protein